MKKVLVLDTKDNVVVALENLVINDVILVSGKKVIVRQNTDRGHKIAAVLITKGEYIIKYGVTIGRAKDDIHPGEHVSVHNVEEVTEEIVAERRKYLS